MRRACCVHLRDLWLVVLLLFFWPAGLPACQQPEKLHSARRAEGQDRGGRARRLRIRHRMPPPRLHRWLAAILVLLAVAAVPAGEPAPRSGSDRVIVGINVGHADNQLDPFTGEAVDPTIGTFAIIVVDADGGDRVVLVGFATVAHRDRFAQLPFQHKRLIADALRVGHLVLTDGSSEAAGDRR